MAIEAKNLIKAFGDPPTQVLKGVSLSISPGELVTITGRSGSGKSTLLYLISTLDHPSGGFVHIDGEDFTKMSVQAVHRFRNLKMGFVFQFHHLLPELTALENVLMPAIKTGRELERRDYALSLLKEFDIPDKAHHLPSQLSGGEQQRVAIARALVMEPEYLFADEPTGNLDSVNGAAVMRILQRINVEKKMAVIYVTHDLEFSRLAKRQINLVDGRQQ